MCFLAFSTKFHFQVEPVSLWSEVGCSFTATPHPPFLSLTLQQSGPRSIKKRFLNVLGVFLQRHSVSNPSEFSSFLFF